MGAEMKSLKSSIICMVIAGGLLTSATLLAENFDRKQKQAQLDAACEAAREKRLAPLRKQFVEQCVRDKEQEDRAACEAYYSDYGAQSGHRAPLFYDLPECVKAFEYQHSERQS